MATTWMPGVCYACARYIDPNLPAPIRPTRSGLFSAARATSMRWRFIDGSAQREREADRDEEHRHQIPDQNDRSHLGGLLFVLLGDHIAQNRRRQCAENKQQPLLCPVKIQHEY